MFTLQNSQLSASLHDVQLSAASSVQKHQLETSRQEDVIKKLNDELSESHRRLKSLQHELTQSEHRLEQSAVELKSLRDEAFSKSDEVFMSTFNDRNLAYTF